MKFRCSAAKITIYFSFIFLWMALFINASQKDLIQMTDELDNYLSDNTITQELLQEEKTNLSFPSKKMDWLSDLDSETRHNAVSFSSQSIEHYEDFNDDVIKDMVQKFGLTNEKIKNYYEFVYDAPDVKKIRFDASSDILEETLVIQKKALYIANNIENLYLKESEENGSLGQEIYELDNLLEESKVKDFDINEINRWIYAMIPKDSANTEASFKVELEKTNDNMNHLKKELEITEQEIGWNCIDCTCDNDPISKKCEVCGNSRSVLGNQEDNDKFLDRFINAIGETKDLKVGNYIQAIEQFATIGGCPRTIRIGMVMKVKAIDDDGNVLIRYSYYANEEDCLVSKKDTNKFVNLQLEVFSNGITVSDLQGDWVNSFSFYFAVTDRLYTSILNKNIFEIDETENEFFLNQWVLKKKSKTLTWKKGNQEVFWYRPFPPTKYKIKNKKGSDCCCSIL